VQKRSQVLVVAKVGSSDLDLSLRTSEKYSLTIKSFSSEKVRNEIKVLIESDNFYGFRHGLETLSQLITFDPTEKCLRIPGKIYQNKRVYQSHRAYIIIIKKLLLNSYKNIKKINVVKYIDMKTTSNSKTEIQ